MKRHIPGTNPKWGFEVPEGYTNSIVDKSGRIVDTGWNFDEKDDEEPTYDDLAKEPEFDPKTAQKAKEEALQKSKE